MQNLKKIPTAKEEENKSTQKQKLRKEKTIKGLVKTLKKLEDMQYLSKDQSQSLLSNFGHMTKDIFINEQKNTNKSKFSRYTDTIKQFAVSLHFYSSRAYKFVQRWDIKNKKFAGNTDYGTILAEEQDSTANNALVVMAVGLKNPWYHPIAYFLVDHVNAVMQAQIIKESINLLTDAGLDVHGVTFDGWAKNLGTARQLGCNLD